MRKRACPSKSRSLAGRRRGFTLIEILIVITIIGLLAYYLVPRLLGTEDRAKEAAVKAVMHSVQISIESYNLENETYPVAQNITLRDLCDNYLLPANYIGSVPKNPFTGQLYTANDVAGKIMYTFDNKSGKYTLSGYDRGGNREIFELSNI